ncbi:MAG: HEAT repeat domain-containing protein, partial [Planctomycetota bacterium]|nr:HEAT repeat domain-containing protein [Planctomycetota bacterium]
MPTRTVILTIVLVSCKLSAQVEVDALTRLGSTDHRTRHLAFQELRKSKTPDTLIGLSKVLPGYQYHSQNLGLSLVQGFGRDRGEPVLRGFLKGKPSYLRLGAAVQLYQWGDRSVDVHIAECLRAKVIGLFDRGARIDSEAELSGMLSRAFHINSQPVLSAVQGCLVPSAPVNVLDPALRMLQRFKVTAAIPRVEAVLKDPGLAAESRALCAAFLVGMGESSHSATCAEAIAEIKHLSRIVTLLRDAAYLDKVVLAAVLEFAEGKKGANVRHALELLARHNYRPAVPAIREMLKSEDVETSKAAFHALMRIADGLEVKQLRRLLTDSSDAVALAAADALRRLD